jgi:hypothetical protein
MITVKFTAILAIAAILALSPSFTMTTMTALAVKDDVSSSSVSSKHFDGDTSNKQITHSIDKHFKNKDNNNNFFNNKNKLGDKFLIHHNDNNKNNFKKHNDNFKFDHNNNDGFRFFNNHNHDHNDNVKVIHKTVVVHDSRNNNQQKTIVINTNIAGTCFVTQSQIANTDNLLSQLLDQCASITIVQG